MVAEYRINGAKADDFETIYATHPAQPGSYLCYAWRDGSVTRSPIILWGVLANGSPEPITLDGVWDGVDQRNAFVLFPDGRCGRFEEDWENEQEAAEALREFDPS